MEACQSGVQDAYSLAGNFNCSRVGDGTCLTSPCLLYAKATLDDKLTPGAGKPCPLLCLGAGTPHKPAVITRKGHVLHEASAYTEHLVAQVKLCYASALELVIIFMISKTTHEPFSPI